MTKIVTVAFAFIAALMAAAGTQPPMPDPSSLTWTPATLTTAAGTVQIEAERGRLVVPERWSRPNGRTITLNLIRLRATSADPGPPVVYLAGGPGGSGITSVLGDRYPLFDRLRQAGDVITLDQRGVRSEPFPSCPQPFVLPLDQPPSLAAWLPVYRAESQRCATRWRESGLDIAAYNTVESAADLNALSRALGTPLRLLGISYGTHLGLQVIKRHPDAVERAVLAGVEGPDDTLKLPAQLDAHLAAIAAVIAADDTARRLVPDLLTEFRTALEWLAPGRPVDLPGAVRVVVGPADLQLMTLELTTERDSLQRFPAAFARVRDQQLEELGRWAVLRRRRPGLQVLSMMADCASGASPARRQLVADQAGRSLMGDAANWPFPEVCDAWQPDTPSADDHAPVAADTPVLLISGSLDARTPPANAHAASERLTRARHLLLDPAGHDDDLLISTPEIGSAILQFLRGAPTPERITLPPLRFRAQ